jgi:hypothetical protein
MHCPSPQPPQSTGHAFGLSDGEQMPSPHTVTQSTGHVIISPAEQN